MGEIEFFAVVTSYVIIFYLIILFQVIDHRLVGILVFLKFLSSISVNDTIIFFPNFLWLNG